MFFFSLNGAHGLTSTLLLPLYVKQSMKYTIAAAIQDIKKPNALPPIALYVAPQPIIIASDGYVCGGGLNRKYIIALMRYLYQVYNILIPDMLPLSFD